MSIRCPQLDHLSQALESIGLGKMVPPLSDHAQHYAQSNAHGHREKWQALLADLPDIVASSYDFTAPIVRIGAPQDCDFETQANLRRLMLQLSPWRKGPFDLFGLLIDGEWRSNLKWERLAAQITPLHGRSVLDIGCGNGYYLWRMLGQGACLALGIDPTQLFITQFDAIKRYCPDSAAFVLPLTAEQFPSMDVLGFDTVFSMGVLSHRRDVHAHLRQLLAFARPGGEVIIETLIVDGKSRNRDFVLTPADRYAKMRNVWQIPTPLVLEKWLQQAGAVDIRLLDVSQTTIDEQRVTKWMQFESLADFLDPNDSNQTIEGYPAPKRSIFLCARGAN